MTDEPPGARRKLPISAILAAQAVQEPIVDEGQVAEDKDRDEYFKQYWQYATNLRNWFIAYGVGCILLLTRVDAVFNVQPQATIVEPGLKLQAISLFILGLATQVGLTLVNKIIHYYAYQKFVVEPVGRRHTAATWLCNCFWIDVILDTATLGFYLAGTVTMARLF